MAITISGLTFSGGFQLQPPYVPNAPTVGTATATGATTATVAFTAPGYGGTSTITTYTATSSPGGITGTLSQAGSGTITVSGLSSSTSYTFTVTATNSEGTSVASSASNSITTQTVVTLPGAPTIGTATATGATTSRVAFTAPASNGGGTITTYTATSSPGGITGTLSQAGSGTITVTGLSANTAYTFTVTATNSAGTGSASSASNSTTTGPSSGPPTVIGQPAYGGYYAGQISTTADGVATHYLIVSDATVGYSDAYKWGPWPGSVTGFNSRIDGPGNTSGLAALGSQFPAAYWCENLNIGGYTDWYLPALDEMQIIYSNLKPSTQSNGGTIAPNQYSVPKRDSNTAVYQTTAVPFKTGSNSQEFNTYFNWTSTEFSQQFAYRFLFENGGYDDRYKDQLYYWTRAVRRVPV